MAIIVDLVIIAVLVIFVIVGVKRGFVLTLLPVISVVVAILLGIALKGPVRSLLGRTQMEQKITVSVTNIAQKALDKINGSKDVNAEEQKKDATDASAIPKYISDTVKNWLAKAGENIFGEDTDTAERLGTKAASLIMDLIAFLIIAVIAIIVAIVLLIGGFFALGAMRRRQGPQQPPEKPQAPQQQGMPGQKPTEPPRPEGGPEGQEPGERPTEPPEPTQPPQPEEPAAPEQPGGAT